MKQERLDFVEFLEGRLIPDLKDSGHDCTAEDFEKAVKFIRELDQENQDVLGRFKTSVTFRTNIDCCKRFMSGMSGMLMEIINPLVDDLVKVYSDSEFELWLRVVSRKWNLTNKSSPELIIELGTDKYWSCQPLTNFIEMMGKKGL